MLISEAYEVSPELGRQLTDEAGDPISCWQRCVRLQPSNKEAWQQLANAYFARDDQANAMKALNRVVKLDPRSALAWNRLAILTMPAPGDEDLKRLDRAESYLRKAIAADPRGKKLGWEPYAWLAEIAERQRDDPGALAWYTEANRRGDRYAAARKQVIENHGARRRRTRKLAKRA